MAAQRLTSLCQSLLLLEVQPQLSPPAIRPNFDFIGRQQHVSGRAFRCENSIRRPLQLKDCSAYSVYKCFFDQRAVQKVRHQLQQTTGNESAITRLMPSWACCRYGKRLFSSFISDGPPQSRPLDGGPTDGAADAKPQEGCQLHRPTALVVHAVMPALKRHGTPFVPKTREELLREAEETVSLIVAAGMKPVPFYRPSFQLSGGTSCVAGAEDVTEKEALAVLSEKDVAAVSLVRLRRVDKEFFFTKGQLEELCGFVQRNPCNYVVISCSSSSYGDSSCESMTRQQQQRLEYLLHSTVLSGSKQRTEDADSGAPMPEKTETVEVIDRTQLVLEIFARRAHNELAKLQVAIACTKRLVSLLADNGTTGRLQLSRTLRSLAAQGIDNPCIKHLQASVHQGMDRRKALKEISRLYKSLEARMQMEREHRSVSPPNREGLPVVGLVGYSSSGKTALMNRMCLCEEPSGAALCMTLGVLQRRARLRGAFSAPFLLLDSVGFVSGVAAAARGIIEDGLREVAARSSVLLLLVDPVHPRWRERRHHALKVLMNTSLKMKPVANEPSALILPSNKSIPWKDVAADSSTRATATRGSNGADNSSSDSSNGSSRSSSLVAEPISPGEKRLMKTEALSRCMESRFGGRLIEVWTKFDLVTTQQQFDQIRMEMPHNALPISSVDGTGIDELSQVLKTAFKELESQEEALIDFEHGEAGVVVPYLHKYTHVFPESLVETDDRLSLRVVAPSQTLSKTAALFPRIRMQLLSPSRC